jgi:hypothetical protein
MSTLKEKFGAKLAKRLADAAAETSRPDNVISAISPTGHRLLYLYNAARAEGRDGIVGSKFTLAILSGGVSLKTLNRALKTLQFEKTVKVDDQGGVVAIIAASGASEPPVCVYLG